MKMPIKKYVIDESKTWEERYHDLEKHHIDETSYLFEYGKTLETENKKLMAELSEYRSDYRYNRVRQEIKDEEANLDRRFN